MKIQKQFDNEVWFTPIDFGTFEVTLFCVLPHYQTNQWSIRLKVSGAAKNESPFVTLSYISGTKEDAIRAAERIADCLFSKQCNCSTDKAAHVLMQFDAETESLSGRTTVGNYVAFYHENRLYSVRNTETDIISLVKASNPYVAIEKVMGNVKETEPKTHSVNREKAAKDFSDFEQWAYEWYVFEWCIHHDTLPENIRKVEYSPVDQPDVKWYDSAAGMYSNGALWGINHFVNEVLARETVRDRYEKAYTLCRLLEWMPQEYTQHELSSLGYNKAFLTEDELITYTSLNKELEACKNVLCVDCNKLNARLDELLKLFLGFVRNVKAGHYMNFIQDIVLKLGLNVSLIQRYIDIPEELSEEEYKSRLIAIDDYCQKRKATFANAFYDGTHLNSFWYNNDKVAFISYAGCTARFYVHGEIDAHLYDKNGYIKLAIVHHQGDRPLFRNKEVCEAIHSDAFLFALANSGKLEYFIQPWVELEIRCDNTNKIIGNQSTRSADSVLFAVEDCLEYIFSTIDRFNKKNACRSKKDNN